MTNYTLKVKERKPGEGLFMLKKTGLVAAVIYGKGFDNQFISVPYHDFQKIYKEAGDSVLINLAIENKEPFQVLIQEVQTNPLTDEVIHIDFYKVKMDKTIRHEIHLKFIGESEAVKNLGGILIHNLSSIEIECLPKDLISEIEVDISNLKNLHDSIKIKDLHLSANIKILSEPETIIATVVEPKKEKEEEKVKTDKEVEKEAIENIKSSAAKAEKKDIENKDKENIPKP